MSKRKTYSRKTVIPFAGFYESWHDQMLDDAFESILQDSNGSPYERLMEIGWDTVTWHPVHVAYAKAYCEALAERFKIKVLYEELISPREYNFTTDRIFVYIPLSEVYRLRRIVCEATFMEVCAENLTSRSGFSSFYNPNPQTWGPVAGWDHNQISMLVAAHIRQENEGKDMAQDEETELMESYRDNGYFDDWVYSNMNEKGKRLEKIAAYLRERYERRFRPLRRASSPATVEAPNGSP